MDDQERYFYKSGNFELDGKINEWLAWDQNATTSAAIRRMVRANKFDELYDCLMSRLTFGTSGLRGRMIPGYKGMNDLVVVQTAQGILKYLEQLDQVHLKQSGIVVGHDVRYNSKRFSELVATVFLNKNYTVRHFNVPVPSTFVPFAVTKHKCIMGIMITASQNEKEDNGFKIYGSNGCMIIPPAEGQIEMNILHNLEPHASSWLTEIVDTSDKSINATLDITRAYFEMLSRDLVEEHKIINSKSNLKFTYTPLHGVGYSFFSRLMEKANLTIVPVEQQAHPNPEFPTVKYPNPEEGRKVLELAVETANEHKCTVILATDCDGGRLGVAELNTRNGHWYVFNGNEIGSLLGWWAIHCYQAHYPNEYLHNIYMITSTVTSKILRNMGKMDGFHSVETHTGFKWIGQKAYDLIQMKKKVIFAFQECYGYMWGTTILDKDGLLAGVHIATMAAYLNHHGVTLLEHLTEMYLEYGHHVCIESYYLCKNRSVVGPIFDRIRNYDGPHSYPTSLGNGKYIIKHVRDLSIGYDDSQAGNKSLLQKLETGQTMTFEFNNNIVATLRTSGTESKIKYFAEIYAKPKQGSKKELQTILSKVVNAIIEELLQPAKNGLIPKAAAAI